LTCKFKAN